MTSDQQPNSLNFKPEPVPTPSNYEEQLDKEMMQEFITQNVFRLDQEEGVQQLLACAAFYEHSMQVLNNTFPIKTPLTSAAEWVNELIRRRAELPGVFVTSLPVAPNKDDTVAEVVMTKFDSFEELVVTIKGCLERGERVYLYNVVSARDNKPMLRWLHY